MVIILVNHINSREEAHSFGGIACDVCEEMAPDVKDRRDDLMALGWFIAPGKHRCPKHHHDDVPARGPQHRTADVAVKRL
jgi:hypothetical protein